MIKLNIDIPANMLKTQNEQFSHYSYLDGRKCKFCQTPFPDHTNKSREFCEKHVFPDGRVKDCKSLYWTPERRIESKKEKKQQQICSSFQELLNFGKTEMTWEEFCTKGLSLKLANETYISEDARIVAKFNEGYLIIDPITYKIKITI
jgi:hypothetical protein